MLMMYGYVNENEPLINHIRYNHQRRDHAHIFSAKGFGYAFGFREYESKLSVKHYLELPIDQIEDVLEGINRGTEHLLTEKKKLADKLAADEKRKAENQKP